MGTSRANDSRDALLSPIKKSKYYPIFLEILDGTAKPNVYDVSLRSLGPSCHAVRGLCFGRRRARQGGGAGKSVRKVVAFQHGNVQVGDCGRVPRGGARPWARCLQDLQLASTGLNGSIAICKLGKSDGKSLNHQNPPCCFTGLACS